MAKKSQTFGGKPLKGSVKLLNTLEDRHIKMGTVDQTPTAEDSAVPPTQEDIDKYVLPNTEHAHPEGVVDTDPNLHFLPDAAPVDAEKAAKEERNDTAYVENMVKMRQGLGMEVPAPLLKRFEQIRDRMRSISGKDMRGTLDGIPDAQVPNRFKNSNV